MAFIHRSTTSRRGLVGEARAGRIQNNNNHAFIPPLLPFRSSHRPSRAVGAGRGPYPRPPLHPPQLALDPPTREIAKQYFKIIQALHHKNIIDTAVEKQEPPRGMLRQILKLTSFIKPSSPSDSVRQAVQDNTTNWTLNNLRILQTHYSTLLSDFNPPPHNPLAFQVASKWAQK
ncbi:uncharacterized protein V6R79_011188, partial [Siganus canaliculatus]